MDAEDAAPTAETAALRAYAAGLEGSGFLLAVRDLFSRQAELLDAAQTRGRVRVYVAGGAAVHWWTRERATDDVDAEFSVRFVPGDVRVGYVDAQGAAQEVYLDRCYNPMFSLLHEDYQDDSVPVSDVLGADARFDIYVLSPLHLAISKLARFADNDQADIAALARRGLLDVDVLERKALEALHCAIGVQKSLVEVNIREAVAIIRREGLDEHTKSRLHPSW